MSAPHEMSQAYTPIGQASVDARARFITRTYNHLMGSIVLFTLIEVWLFTTGMAESIASAMLGGSWLMILGGFMLVTWLATRAAHTSESKPAQYAALLAVVTAYAVLFVPMLYIANSYADGTIESAALVTLLGFGGLTAVAFTTRKDFSFMGSALRWGGVLALVAIVSGVLFGCGMPLPIFRARWACMPDRRQRARGEPRPHECRYRAHSRFRRRNYAHAV